LRFLPNLTDFQADYITMVEDRPIMSVKYCPSSSLLLLSETITHPAARLSAIAEHLVSLFNHLISHSAKFSNLQDP